MKKIIVICGILLLGCQEKETEQLPIKIFYDFDAIEYYKFHIGFEGIDELLKPPPPPQIEGESLRQEQQYQPTAKEISDRKLYFNALPEHLDEKTFAELTSQVNKTKVVIGNKYLKQLKTEIFIEKDCEEPSIPSIIPIYTDVFVFKKGHKIIGTLQLDSSNFIHIFTGTKKNTKCFGFHGEIEALQKIIKIPSFRKNY